MSYSIALTVCPHLPEGWLSWGAFCDSQYAVTKDAVLLESSATAYVQAIRHGNVTARGMIPRLLNMLAFDNDNGAVGKAIEKGCRQVYFYSLFFPQKESFDN